MRNIFSRKKIEKKRQIYVCSVCGESHEEWPAITFESPDGYNVLPAELKQSIGYLDTDFCIVRHDEQTDRFIRVTMTQKVNDCEQDLEYGIWVSLSEKNFDDYKANFNNEEHERRYFGWLSNDLPEYEVGKPIPTDVMTKRGNIRPEIFPHETCNHLLVKDYYSGITKKEALIRIERMKK